MAGRIEPVQPKITKADGKHYDYTEEHPAYAQIGASRVTSTPGEFLYGSDFRHNHFVMIRINRSMMTRGLSHDWHHERDELVEVALSEAQWATFVSTLNMGSGTPCTFSRINRQQVPGIVRTTDRRQQFKDEVGNTIADGIEALQDLRSMIDTLKVSATAKEGLTRQVDTALRELQSNVPFVAKSFDDHVERTTERAKIEVNAYLTNMVQRAGLKALQDGNPVKPPLELDEPKG